MNILLGDIVTEQKLLEILNQLSNGGSAIQLYITHALTDRKLYEEFTTDREKRIEFFFVFEYFVYF